MSHSGYHSHRPCLWQSQSSHDMQKECRDSISHPSLQEGSHLPLSGRDCQPIWQPDNACALQKDASLLLRNRHWHVLDHTCLLTPQERIQAIIQGRLNERSNHLKSESIIKLTIAIQPIELKDAIAIASDGLRTWARNAAWTR